MTSAEDSMLTRQSPGTGAVGATKHWHQRICILLLSAVAVVSALASLFHFAALQWIDRWTFLAPSQVPELYATMLSFGIIAALTAGGALLLRRRRVASERLAQLCLLGAAVFGVAVVDRSLAIAYPPPSELNSLLEPHPERGWALRRNVVGNDADVVTGTNSLGLRGPEVALPKPAGEFRVLFVGDSVTFGYGLADEQTLPARVGERLRRHYSGRDIRCVNAGVSGYTTWQELHYVQTEGLSLQPDLVVLQMSLNDILDVVLVTPGRVHGRPIEFEFSNTTHWSGIVRAITSLRARRYWRQAKERLKWIDERNRQKVRDFSALETMFADNPPPVIEEAWQRVLADLTAFDEVYRSQGLSWVLVVSPPKSQLTPNTDHIKPQKRLSAWADQHKVPMFDPLPLIKQYGKLKGLSADALYLDEGHPTPATMALIAEALAEFLVERGLAGPGATTDPAPPR